MGLSNVFCPLCQSGSHRSIKTWSADKEYTLMHCLQCDLQFWWPLERPNPTFYADADGYSTHLPHVEVTDWPLIQSLLGGLSGKALDVGCGSGLLMRKMIEMGLEAWGVDFDSNAITVARASGLDHLFAGPFEEYARTCISSFDLMTCFDVLEHQNEPLVFVREIRRLLKPGGWFVGAVPNRGRFQWGENQYCRPPFHFLEWSQASLYWLFQKEEFTVASLQVYEYGYLSLRTIEPFSWRIKSLVIYGGDQGSNAAKLSLDTADRLRNLKQLKDIIIAPARLMESLIEKPFAR